MNVLFEDDGQLKAGTVLADQDASLQVEVPSGKRIKVKAGNVLLRFASPAASEVLAEGGRLAAELDPTFLWEVGDEGEFDFADLAREYYGNAPTPGAVGRGGDAAACLAHALLQEGQGTLPQGARRFAQGSAGLGRAQGARGRADRGMDARAPGRHAA